MTAAHLGLADVIGLLPEIRPAVLDVNVIVYDMSANKITAELRRDILSDYFPAGSRLLESELCERYGVGRGTVRVALLELAGEGLVAREANRGARVRRLTVAEAVEVTEARGALEALVAGYAAKNATAAQVRALRLIITRMRAAVECNDARAYRQLDVELHNRIQEVSRHTVASVLVSNLRNRAVHHQYPLSAIPGRHRDSLAQHEAIVEAIASHDQEEAARAMAAHLSDIVRVLEHWAELRQHVLGGA